MADVRSYVSVSGDDYEWFGFDPNAPPPPDDGLATGEVNEVDLNLPDDIISSLTNEIYPLENSSAFAIGVFQIYLRQSLTVVGVSSTGLKVNTFSKRCGCFDISSRTLRVVNPFLN